MKKLILLPLLFSSFAQAQAIESNEITQQKYAGKWECKSSTFTSYAVDYGKTTERDCSSKSLIISIKKANELLVKQYGYNTLVPLNKSSDKQADEVVFYSSAGAFCESPPSLMIPICIHIDEKTDQLVLIDQVGGNHMIVQTFERKLE